MYLKLIGIKFTVHEGSTKADFTLPKNFLFSADPFSKAKRERESDFFSDISKIFNRYSSWSISPIHMFIDIHQYYFFLTYVTNPRDRVYIIAARARSLKHWFFIIWYKFWNLKMKHARQNETKFSECNNYLNCVSPDCLFITLHSKNLSK